MEADALMKKEMDGFWKLLGRSWGLLWLSWVAPRAPLLPKLSFRAYKIR